MTRDWFSGIEAIGRFTRGLADMTAWRRGHDAALAKVRSFFDGDERISAESAHRRVRSLAPRIRRGATALTAYCRDGCAVVHVYRIERRLLVELLGDVLVTNHTVMGDLPRSSTRPARGDLLPHPVHWLDRASVGHVWTVDCRHGAVHPIAADLIRSETPGRGRVTIGVAALAASRVDLPSMAQGLSGAYRHHPETGTGSKP